MPDPEFDRRVQNMYGHEYADLMAREEMLKRGVKPGTPNLPEGDATYHPMEQVASRLAAQRAQANGQPLTPEAQRWLADALAMVFPNAEEAVKYLGFGKEQGQ